MRQSGIMDFQIADIYADSGVLREASEAVRELLELDPDLSLPQNLKLRQALQNYFERQNDDIWL